MAYFPFFADIERKKWLIVGGGGVSPRKIRDLLPYGVIIRVVSTDLFAGLLELGADPVHRGRFILSRWVSEDGSPLDVGFVIAATSDQALNNHISAVCHRQGILVDVVDVKEEYSFIFPFIVRDDPVVVGISTGGASPVIARYLKARISWILSDNLGDLVQQLSGYKGWIEVLSSHPPEVRSDLFYELVEKDLENGCRLTPEQAEIIINRELEQGHE